MVFRHRRGYDLLGLAQAALPRLPLPVVRALGDVVHQPAVLRRILDRYLLALRITAAPTKSALL